MVADKISPGSGTENTVTYLLQRMLSDGSFGFNANTDRGKIWFGCDMYIKPIRDETRYSDADEWIVSTRDIMTPEGALWGPQAIRLCPDKNVIQVLRKETLAGDSSDPEYVVIQEYTSISDITWPS